MSDIAFALNYTNLYMINTTPGPVKTWARIGAGINKVDWDGNEEVSQDSYYDGEGLASSEVTGGQIIGTFDGHRKYGDPAQDFVASLMLEYGNGRKTDLRWIAPDGQVLEGVVTIANIKPQGGDPKAKSDFSFEAHYNGMPKYVAGKVEEFPTAITCTAPTVKVGAVVSVAATVTPTDASTSLVYGVEDDSIATVDADGNVKGIKPGKTKLSVKSAVKPLVNTTCDITVSAAA